MKNLESYLTVANLWYEENCVTGFNPNQSLDGSFDGANGSMQGDYVCDGLSTDERQLVKFQRPRDLSSNGYTKDQTNL